MESVNKLQTYRPTLRLSIIDSCNGICPFCHREGQTQYCSNQIMDLETLQLHIIPAINKLSIQKVILTGGEPTQHPQLPRIARSLRESCPQIHLGITTNGYDLAKIQLITELIDRLTISVSSFKPEIYMKYTQVNPQDALYFIDGLKLKNKAVSIVVTQDNYLDIEGMLEELSSRSYDIKLQYVIGHDELTEDQKYGLLRLMSNSYGEPEVRFAATPSLLWNTKFDTSIRFKLSPLNHFLYENMVHRAICEKCDLKTECVEMGCAVRVYPNGSVSPCLNNHYSFNSAQVIDNIEKAYLAAEIIL